MKNKITHIDFVKEQLLEEIYKIYESKIDEEDFKQGTHHEIFTDEGRSNIESAIKETIDQEYEKILHEYRMALAKREILRQLKYKLRVFSEKHDVFHEEMNELTNELNRKDRALRLIEEIRNVFNNREN